MYTPWVNLLLASGATHSTAAVDKALNSTIHAVHASVQTVHITAQTVSQWDLLRKDLADVMRDILRPVYDWCNDDTLVSSSVNTSPFAAPTPPPSAFWTAEARHSAPSPSYIPEPLPTFSAVLLPKRVPLPTPASRPQPSVVISGWGKWRIASPTATPPVPSTRPTNTHTPPSTHHPRLGPVVMPRVACSQLPPSPYCASNGFIGPRLPTSPIGSFNGTELPVPGHTCSPDDRPLKPRYVWTKRPRCPFISGNLPEHVVCLVPVGLSEHKSIFLDPPGDPRDPIIDLGLALDLIPLYFESIVFQNRRSLQPLQRTTSLRDSIRFKVKGAALTLVIIYMLYFGLPVVTGHKAANVNANERIETIPPQCPPQRRRAAVRTIEPQVNATIDVTQISYFDNLKGAVNGFFWKIIYIGICSCSFVTKTIASSLNETTRLVLGLENLSARIIEGFFIGVISLILFIWRSVRNVVQWVFVATSHVILGTYALARKIVKSSFKMIKDAFAYIAVLRFPPRRVAEQPTAPTVQSISPSADPLTPLSHGSGSINAQQRIPATNSADAQTIEQYESGSSASQSPNGPRSLPPSVADAIRSGNAPSLVRRAGRRRVNLARPARAVASSSS